MQWRDVPLAKKQRFVYVAQESYEDDDDSSNSDEEDEKEEETLKSDLSKNDEKDDDDTSNSDSSEEEEEENYNEKPRISNLLPKKEIFNWRQIKRKKRPTRAAIVTKACVNGTLVGDCFRCTRAHRAPIQEFAPFKSNKNGRKRPAFFKAIKDYEAAYAAGDLEAARAARAIVEKTRGNRCQVCAELNRKLTPAVQACKDFIRKVRDDACRAQDGCCNPNCVERGMQAAWVLQCDHLHTIKHSNANLRKTHILSDFWWWSSKKNGRVEGMQRELDKGVEWKCRFCHMLEPTGTQANKCTDPEGMPDSKARGTEEERAQYDRQRMARIVFPKQQFVDKIKREERKCCLTCKRVVEPGEEHAFIFDHRDPTTKMIGKGTLAGENGGVAGLVNHHTKAATLDKIEHVLLREIGLCDLLCANCDHRKTHNYPERV